MMGSMKKVLVITYYWPPAGGPGVQRVLKFVKYLREYGWEPVVLTVRHPTAPTLDKSLEEEIPGDINIYKTASFEPFTLYSKFKGNKNINKIPKDVIKKRDNESLFDKVARTIRANIFIPDARVGWIPFVVYNGLKIIKREKISAIFSTSPPHSLQIGALILSKITRIKWIADFRDPWNDAYWLKDLKKFFLISYFDKYLERKILQIPDRITTISDEIIELFRNKVYNNYYLLHNGFEIFNNVENNESYFNIIYFGNLTSEASCEELFNAINELPQEVSKKIRIEIIGKVFDGFEREMPKLKYADLKFKGYMSRKYLFRYVQKANLFFNVILKNTSYSKGIIGAKSFDYLALRRPILLIGEKAGAADKLLKETDSGKLFAYNDVNGIKEYVSQKFLEWKNGKSQILGFNKNLENYLTKNNVKKLAKLFEQI